MSNINVAFILFILFLIVYSAFFASINNNAVFSVIWLISCFAYTSLLFFLLGADFLAFVLVIVYATAISILFLYIIMLLNLRITEIYSLNKYYTLFSYYIIILGYIIIMFYSYRELYYEFAPIPIILEDNMNASIKIIHEYSPLNKENNMIWRFYSRQVVPNIVESNFWFYTVSIIAQFLYKLSYYYDITRIWFWHIHTIEFKHNLHNFGLVLYNYFFIYVFYSGLTLFMAIIACILLSSIYFNQPIWSAHQRRALKNTVKHKLIQFIKNYKKKK